MSVRGYSAIELVFVLGLSATLSGIAVPQFLVTLDDIRTVGAARYVAARFQRARMEAVVKSAEVALRFTEDASGYLFTTYVDGNRNGVLAIDIQHGIDTEAGASERLPDNFPGVDFGVLPGLPAVEAGSAPPGSDPLKLGTSNSVSFSPLGSSSSGSVYIRGRGRSQYVVRIYGDTGKTRVLKFNAQKNAWTPL
jgi:hypothetical protein